MSLMNDCLHLQVTTENVWFSRTNPKRIAILHGFSIVHISRKIDVDIYIYINIDQRISFIVPPSTSCAVREKNQICFMLAIFLTKIHKKTCSFCMAFSMSAQQM